MRCPDINELPPPPPGKTGWPWTEGSPKAAYRQGRSRMPRISIVTPSFNQGHLLEETIRSVLLQGYPDLEYFIVDGKSTDNSVEVIRKYQQYLTWWVSEADFGQSHALNKGFAGATGSIHGYLNSDDLLEPGALHSVAHAMKKYPWVVGQVRYLNPEGRTWPLAAYPEHSAVDWFLSCPIPQPGSFWNARLHGEAGTFRQDLHYFFDYDFWMRLRFDCNVRPHIIPQVLAVYRLHAASKTVTYNGSFAREAAIVRTRYASRLNAVQALHLLIAQYRKRACHFGSRAKAKFANGERWAGIALMLIGVLRWPPLLIDKRVLGVFRRLIAGRDAVPADEPPVVWNYYEM